MNHITKDNFHNKFIQYAIEHKDALKTNNYSKRYRLNKKLMEMLSMLDTIEGGSDIVVQIMNSKNQTAILWIYGYADTYGFKSDAIKETIQKVSGTDLSRLSEKILEGLKL